MQEQLEKLIKGAHKLLHRPTRAGAGWGLLLAVLLAAVLFGACRQGPTAAHYDAEVPLAWYTLTLDLVRTTPGYTPPVASRALGYLGVALYESVRPGMPGYASLAGQLNELEGMPHTAWFSTYHWPAAANAALASLTRRLFPTAPPAKRVAIDLLEESFAKRFVAEVDVPTYRRSIAWGEAVADAVYTWSLSDGGDEGSVRNFPDDYVPPTGAGMWESTPPGYANALQPYWGENRPFVLDSGDTCPAPAPLPYSEDPTSAFYREAKEVYDIGKARTREQLDIALFWADDTGRTATPPGHWISILNQVLAERHATLDVAAEGYAKLGIAAADAFVTCWHTKYLYNVMRPITYIQRVIDPTWNTPTITDPVVTPSFPEYTSGHSVQSAAAARILSALFGEGYVFTDHSGADLGLAPRSYPSFAAAAQEAALSQLYGGIHYRSAIEAGLEQGECVAEHVLALRFHR